jgi:hypothetical protein
LGERPVGGLECQTYEARGSEREPQIDTVGWLFLVFAVAITAAAAMIAYKANDTMVAHALVSQLATRYLLRRPNSSGSLAMFTAIGLSASR